MPGTKWWMWRPPTRTLPNGHQPSRMPSVETRANSDAPTKPANRLNIAVSPRDAER